MEQRDGPALSQRERRELIFIEQELRKDKALDLALSTKRRRRLGWLPRRRRAHPEGPADSGG